MTLWMIAVLLQDAALQNAALQNAALQNAAPPSGTGPAVVRTISGVLALIMVGVIIFRRKGAAKKEKEEDC